VAHKLNLDPALLYRLLRTLSSLGLLTETRPDWFSITEAGEFLKSEHPQSLRDLILAREGPEHTAIWKHLPAIVKDGTQNGFVREFGLSAFDYAAQNPDYAAAFDASMSSISRLQTGWVLEALRDYDFATMKCICDVGGGQGYLLSHLLLQYPHLTGIILERAGAIENSKTLWAYKLNVSDRCQYVAGDMFADVPQADAYFMKMILHDWNDEECVRILKNMHRRAPQEGRVFIVEHLISDSSAFANLFDIHMMVWGPGRERTAEEYKKLLTEAGWTWAATRFPPNGVIGIIEAAKL
jgi:hypothetical protein